MTTPTRSPRRAISAALTAALVGGLVLAMPAQFVAAAAALDTAPLPAGATVDEFDSTTLSPSWEINNEVAGSWSLATTPGKLTINSLPGDTYNTDNSQKNVFLTDIPAGDFVVQTTVNADPTLDYQGAGIFAWGDQDNYVRAGLTNVGFAAPQARVIENGVERAANYTSTLTQRAGVSTDTIRVARVGNVVTTSFWDGAAWVTADTQTVAFTVTKLGLYSFSSTGGVSLPATFDYFAYTAAEGQAVLPTGTFALENSSAGKYLLASAQGGLTLSADRPATAVRFTASVSGTGIVLNAEGTGKVLAKAADGSLVLTASPAGDANIFSLRDVGGGKTALFSLAGGTPTRVGVLGPQLSTAVGATTISMKTVAYVADGRSIDIDADGSVREISDDMYGIFYEDINYAADGGLYAELVRNRSFEFNASDRSGYTGLTGWTVLQRGGATGTGTVVTDAQMLNAMNRYYLQLNLTAAGTGAAAGVGVLNGGWNNGYLVEQGKTYDFSVWARRTADFDKPLKVKVENTAGTTVYAEGQVLVTNDTWTKYTVRLTATATTNLGRLSVVAEGTGTVRLDMVSLFPTDTYKGRANGLRKDMAEKIDALNPKFVRFPGGCVTNVGTFRAYGEAGTYDRKRTYQWKETIGPVESRPTNFNFWGYNQTYGLGYLEYLEFAEDLGAEPLPVLSVGINGCGGAAPTTYTFDIDRWVDDTLDLIEFANGDASTEWGAKRIALGHPEPFGLDYIGLGNEENFTAQFKINFPKFQDAIEAVYPNIKIISNSGPDSSGATFDTLWQFNRERNVDIVDEHYYRDPSWFFENNQRYDSYPRTGPKVFLGEYASRGNTFYNALAEASYMTALERNADVVRLASYAPLLAMQHANFATQWVPDMIWFDNSRIYGSANYYVQQLFMNNVGNETVPSTYTAPATPLPDIAGGVALSTWSTAATYDDVKVTKNSDGSTLFADDFSGTASNWTGTTGTWNVTGGEYVQTSTSVTDARRTVNVAGNTAWSNYTLEVKAKKTAGAEGFLVGFGVKDSGNYYWWNLGGFANARSLVEKAVNGGKTEVVGSNTTITTGQTYAIKIVVSGHNVKLYLDGNLINEFTEASSVADPLYQVVTRDTETDELIVKVVNVRAEAVRAEVNTAGEVIVGDTAEVSELTGARTDVNTFAAPTKVATKYATITGTSNSFLYDFPADSVTFLRLGTEPVPVDTTAPVVTAEVAPAAPTGDNGWYTSTATVTVSATDDVDAAVTPEVAITGPGNDGVWRPVAGVIELATSGSYQIAYRAKDAAGNESTEGSLTVKVDVDAPVTVGSVDQDLRKVTLAATDAGSGVATTQYKLGQGDWQTYSGPVTVSKAATTVTFRSTDVAGLVEADQTVQVSAAAAVASVTKLSFEAAKIPVNQRGKATVTVTAVGEIPAGSVAVLEGARVVGTGTLANGKATLTLIALPAGKHVLTARYNGSALVAGSVSSSVTLTLGFVDVPPDRVNFNEIVWAATAKLTSGYAGGLFKPTEPMTRSSAVKFLYAASHGGQTAPKCTSKPFADIAVSHVLCGEIAWAKSAGVVTGATSSNFGPNTTLTREVLATLVYRTKNSGNAPACTANLFTDVPKNSVHCGAIKWAVSEGLMKARAAGVFKPKETVTRETVAVVLYRVWGPNA